MKIPNSYEPLKSDDVIFPPFSDNDVPQFSPARVWFELRKLNPNKSTVPGDFPVKLTKHFAAYLAEPLTDILNTSIKRGEYPNIYKVELSTPVPKAHPTVKTSHLRNISGLFHFDKVIEKLLAELIISDIQENLDPSQYGNQRQMSIQHYLVKMLHSILRALDDSSKKQAVLANFIDWDNAFPRQCPKLGVQSFLKNGVRPSLMPVLINYFQDRHMSVKWHGHTSKPRKVNGGGPAGATLGLLEYISQSNDCADAVPVDDRFRFVDDLSFLEIINLLMVGLVTFDVSRNVSSNLLESNLFLPPESLKSQQYL